MSERRWQLFAVRCATCEKLLMTAPLIGAAPALLDAAQHALARLELEVREGRVDPADYAITMGKLRDAISEATGEQE